MIHPHHCCVMQAFTPVHMLLNGRPCRLTLALNLTAPVPTFANNGILVEDSHSPITAELGQFTGLYYLPLLTRPGLQCYALQCRERRGCQYKSCQMSVLAAACPAQVMTADFVI